VKAVPAKQRRRARLGIVAAVLAVPTLVAAACAPKNSASGAGQECFVATDCEPGLVCVPQRGGARLCSADLSQVTGRPPGGPPMADGGDAATDGPVADGPEQETGADTGVDTGVDTGIQDAGDAG
jgi:hypothetical protein